MKVIDAVATALKIRQDEQEREEKRLREYMESGPQRALQESARQQAERIAATQLPANAAAEQWRRERGYEDTSEERAARQQRAIDARNAHAAAVREAFAQWDARVAEARQLENAATHDRDVAIKEGRLEDALVAQQRVEAAAALPAVIEELKRRQHPPTFPPELALAGRA